MAVHVVVKSASDLPKLDVFSKIDPYCDLTFHEEKSTTKTISNDQSPEWNETFKWTLEVVPGSDEAVKVDIVDFETLGKSRPVAKGVIPLATALEQGSDSQEVSLTSPEGEALESKLFVDVKYRVPVSEALKKELDEAKNNGDLEEQLKKLRAQAAENERELTAQLQSVTSELDGLKSSLAQKMVALAQTKAQLEAGAKNEEALTEKVESLTSEVGALKSTVEQKEAELSQCKEENKSIKAKLSGAEAEIKQLEVADQELKVQNQSLNKEVAELTQKVKGLELDIENKNSQSQPSDDDDALKAQNESLKEEIANLKQEVEDLREQATQSTSGGSQEQKPATGEQEQQKDASSEGGWCNIL